MKILSILLVLLLFSGGGGCVGNNHEAVKKDMLSYLRNKYDQEFVIEDFYPGGSGFNRPVYDEGLAHPANDSNKKFCVQRKKRVNDYYFTDGYTFRLAEVAFTHNLSAILADKFGESKFSVRISKPEPEASLYDFQTEFDLYDFLNAEPHLIVSVRIYLPYNQFDKNLEAKKITTLMHLIHKMELLGFVTVFYVPDIAYNFLNPDSLIDEKITVLIREYDIRYYANFKLPDDNNIELEIMVFDETGDVE